MKNNYLSSEAPNFPATPPMLDQADLDADKTQASLAELSTPPRNQNPRNPEAVAKEHEQIASIQKAYSHVLETIMQHPAAIGAIAALKPLLEAGAITPTNVINPRLLNGEGQAKRKRALNKLAATCTQLIQDELHEAGNVDKREALLATCNSLRFCTSVVDIFAGYFLREADGKKLPFFNSLDEQNAWTQSLAQNYNAAKRCMEDFLAPHIGGLNAIIAQQTKHLGDPKLLSLMEDLEQEAAQALVIALHRFDLDQPVLFMTFAQNRIRRSVFEYLLEHSHTIRIKKTGLEEQRRLEQAREQAESFTWKHYGRAPFPIEADDATRHLSSAVDSLFDTEYSDLRNVSGSADLDCSPSLASPSDEQEELKLILTKALQGLPPILRVYIAHRFGLNGEEPKEFREIGEMSARDPSGVRARTMGALARLKIALQIINSLR